MSAALRPVLLLLVAAVGVVLLIRVVARPAPRATSRPAIRPVVGPRSEPPPIARGFIGVITSAQAVNVAPPIQTRLLRCRLRPGSRVARGDVLAVIDTSALRSELAMARAALAGARADAAQARTKHGYATWKRRQRVIASVEIRPGLAAVSPAEVLDARQQERVAAAGERAGTANVTQQREKVRQLELKLADADLRAPFDGTVALRFADEGALVGPNVPILRLIASGRQRIRFAVPEQSQGQLAIGGHVRVVAGDEPPLEAAIETIAPEIEPASRTLLVEALLPDGSALRAGCVVRVTLEP